MKKQTGETPRPRGEATRGLLSLFGILGFLAFLTVGICVAQQESPEKSPEELEQERINRVRMRLFAQTQKAAAGNRTTGTAAAADEASSNRAGGGNAPTADPSAPSANGPVAPPQIPAGNATAGPAANGNAPANGTATTAPADNGDNTDPAPAADPDADPAATPVAPTPSQGGGRPGFERGFGPPGAARGFGPGGGNNAGGGVTQTPGGEVTLQFPLNPVSDLLNIYERLIGKTIIKDTTVFDGPQVSLVTPTTVPREEAVRLIEATLLVNGYVIVTEPGQKSVKVLFGGPRQGAQSASFSEGVVIYTGDEELPSGESLVGYFMQLDYVDPDTASTIFGNHVVLNEFGRITPVLSPAGLLITESNSIVRQLIRLRQIIDVPADEAPLLTEFVQLEFAEANIVAQIIQAAMDARREEAERQGEVGRTVSGQSAQQGQQNQQSQSQRSSQPQRSSQTVYVRGPDGRMVAQQAGSNAGIGTAASPAAQLIPDDRLNRIMVVAAPTDVAYILDLIKEFDQPLDAPEPVVRPLNYIKANDILPVIVDVLQDTGTGQTQLPGGRQIDSRPTPVTSSQLATLTGVQSAQQNNQNRNVQAGTEEIGGRADQIAFPLDEVAPISVLVGKTRIIADRQSNTIITIGSKENQQIVLDTIDLMDKKPVQVYLATVIGELTINNDRQIGIDYIQKFTQFSGANPDDGGIASSLINGRDDIITNQNIADLRDNIITSPFGPASGLNIYGQIGQNLDVIISALETSQDFKVLSRPVVYTQNGKRAEITSGQEVPVPVDSLTDTTNPGAVRSSIDYKEVVLKLEVLPTINADGEVTLDIVQINDRVVGEQLVAENLIPIIGKQELNTTVTVPTDSTIVLGGLITESDDQKEEGFPFVKNIPILGRAVKSTQDTVERKELMIFIQPVVVMDDEETFRVSHDEDVRSQVGEDAARVFPGPGTPTEQFEQEQLNQEENRGKQGFLGKLGRKIFGKKRPEGGFKPRDDTYSTEEIALPNRYREPEIEAGTE